MSHGYSRHTRVTLAFAFVCAASLTLASHARAQIPAVSSPFGDSVCLAPSDVTAELADPNGYYAGSPKCESLCKRAGADCAQYVKLAWSCQKAEIGDDATYAKQECEVENEHGTATTVCKTEIEHGRKTEQSGALEDRHTALDVCDQWEHDCEQSCP